MLWLGVPVMNTSDHPSSLPPRACQPTRHARVHEARRVLWHEFRREHASHEQQPLDALDAGCEPASLAQFLRARPAATSAARAAQAAIWRLFEDGQIDDASATVALLAIHVGLQRGTGQPGDQPRA